LSILLNQLEMNRYQTLHSQGFMFHQQWAHVDLSKAYGLIIGYAWTCLKAGAYELGCQAIETALNKQRLAMSAYEQLFMNLQIIRFLSHQYLTITNEIFPANFNHLQEKDVTGIYFIKAYAATLVRNLNIAEIYFNKCNINVNTEMTDEESLYRLNIYALFLVLKGEIELALTLELQIKQFIKHNQIN